MSEFRKISIYLGVIAVVTVGALPAGAMRGLIERYEESIGKDERRLSDEQLKLLLSGNPTEIKTTRGTAGRGVSLNHSFLTNGSFSFEGIQYRSQIKQWEKRDMGTWRIGGSQVCLEFRELSDRSGCWVFYRAKDHVKILTSSGKIRGDVIVANPKYFITQQLFAALDKVPYATGTTIAEAKTPIAEKEKPRRQEQARAQIPAAGPQPGQLSTAQLKLVIPGGMVQGTWQGNIVRYLFDADGAFTLQASTDSDGRRSGTAATGPIEQRGRWRIENENLCFEFDDPDRQGFLAKAEGSGCWVVRRAGKNVEIVTAGGSVWEGAYISNPKYLLPPQLFAALDKLPYATGGAAKAPVAALDEAAGGAPKVTTIPAPTPRVTAKPTPSPTPVDPEIAEWQAIKDGGDVAAFEGYLKRHPNGLFAEVAKVNISNLKAAARQKDEVAVWAAIKGSKRVSDFEDYLARYTQGLFAEVAKVRVRQLAAAAAPKREAEERKAELDQFAMFRDIDFGTYHALVIGNNDYGDLPDLKTAAGDAEAIAALLRDTYGFKVKLLTNATRGDIVKALFELRKTLIEEDNLLVYYAGHGWLDEDAGRGYWLPVDAERDNPSNWISNATITDSLKAMQAKHVMVVADSCYSGTLTRAAKIETQDTDYVRRMAERRTRVAMSSGGLEPVADSGGGKHSVFARVFIDVLSRNRGVIEGTRLFNELRRPVMTNAPQTPEYSDIRFAGHDGGDFLFVRKK